MQDQSEKMKLRLQRSRLQLQTALINLARTSDQREVGLQNLFAIEDAVKYALHAYVETLADMAQHEELVVQVNERSKFFRQFLADFDLYHELTTDEDEVETATIPDRPAEEVMEEEAPKAKKKKH